MNKILQGYLLLDTETSKELKKKGVVEIHTDTQSIIVHYDGKDLNFENQALCKLCLYVSKNVEVVRVDDDFIEHLSPEDMFTNVKGELVKVERVYNDFAVCEKEVTPVMIKDVLYR